MFEIGDRVRLKKEEIKYFHDNPNEGWSDDAHDTFRSGRVFVVTNVITKYREVIIEIDNGRGGTWPMDSFVKWEPLSGDLFTI